MELVTPPFVSDEEPFRTLPGLGDVFRIAYEQSAAGVSIAAMSGEYLHANAAFCEFVGYSLGELRMLGMFDLMHPDDRARARDLQGRLERGEAVGRVRWERRYIHKSGRVLWAMLTTSIVRADETHGYYLSQVIDITDRKAAEEGLKLAEAKWRALIGAMQDVILVLDRTGRYVDIAPSATTRLYRPPEELKDRRVHDVFPRQEADLFQSAINRALDGNAPVELKYDLEIDGERYYFDATVSPLLNEHVVWVARDVTARSRAEVALRESEDQLRQAQKMEAVGQLAGGIAHDFNNLLMAIMSNAELAALELAGAAPVGVHIDEIKSASRRARALTQQLLAFSRKQMLQPRVLDMNAVVRESEQILRRLIGENIVMDVALDPTPWQVRADQGQLAQVLMNLVVNARDALPHGGHVRIETAHRVVESAEARAHRGLKAGEYMTLRVRDSGVGMDEDTKARIFEPFFTTKPPGQGTGLGLSTAYGIVKQSGGYIAVDSVPGEGTTFTVYLPRVLEPPDAPAPPVPLPESPTTEAQGMVLLVEDELAVREATKRMLRKFGFEVVEAKNGQEALQVWEKAVDTIDVVLTDVVMPIMGGAAMVQAMRGQRPGIRVVFMSGYTQGAIEPSSVDESCTRFLPKPFTADQLVRTLRELVPATR